MGKSKFDISDKVSGAGKKVSSIFSKTKDALTKAADQNDDGKFDKEDVEQVASAIKKSADETAKQLELKILQPVFPSDIDSGDFLLNKFIRVANRDKRRAESEVCQGSIGYFTNHKGVHLLNIFRDSADIFGITFYPDNRSEFYYVDPSDRDRYIALDDYFSYLKMERVSELQRIAQDLGAKHFRVTYMEDRSSFTERKMSGNLNAANTASSKTTHQSEKKEYSTIEIAAEMECAGHAPVKPKLVIAGREFNSRLFLGTGKFNSDEVMEQSILASGTEMVTVAMKRIELDNKEDNMLVHIQHPGIQLLPNTSGVRNAEEAVFAAQMAREAFGTNWLKLEIHPDPRYLLPDSVETLKATEELVKLGFVVLPYCQADPTLCKRLEEAGAATVMPLGAPIGTNKGLQTRDFLRIIIEQANIPVVVDAGIGAPSHAAEAMEMGASACLVNTAIAVAGDPVTMAVAFKQAVEAGRMAYEAGLGIQADNFVAEASSPLTAFLNEK